MEKLLAKSAFLREEMPTMHVRGLYQKIDWADRLIGFSVSCINARYEPLLFPQKSKGGMR